MPIGCRCGRPRRPAHHAGLRASLIPSVSGARAPSPCPGASAPGKIPSGDALRPMRRLRGHSAREVDSDHEAIQPVRSGVGTSAAAALSQRLTAWHDAMVGARAPPGVRPRRRWLRRGVRARGGACAVGRGVGGLRRSRPRTRVPAVPRVGAFSGSLEEVSIPRGNFCRRRRDHREPGSVAMPLRVARRTTVCTRHGGGIGWIPRGDERRSSRHRRPCHRLTAWTDRYRPCRWSRSGRSARPPSRSGSAKVVVPLPP